MRHAERRAALSITEAAEVFGITPSLAYEWANSGELPTVQIGRRRVVPVRRLAEYIAEKRK